MKSLKIPLSADTYTAIARALAWNKKGELMMDKLKEANGIGIQFGEVHIMEIIKTMAAAALYAPIPQVSMFTFIKHNKVDKLSCINAATS